MNSRKQFLSRLAEQSPSRVEQAIALLWYYEQTQVFSERSAADLSKDIQEEGFGRQNPTNLKSGLRRHNRRVVSGSTRGTFRINTAYFHELSEKYVGLLDIVEPPVTSSVIPLSFFSGTRIYLERLIKQINGSYDAGFFDASAVILRRLMESLLIEIYISQNRESEIKKGGVFMQLNNIIIHTVNDPLVNKSRGFDKRLNLIKDIGDTAAHDRFYITPKQDIDDNRADVRKIINELAELACIRK